MVVQVTAFFVLCVVCCVCVITFEHLFTMLHVVSHCCSSSRHACSFLCLLSLYMLVPSFVNLGMALCSIASLAFLFFYKCYCWRRVCRFHFRMFVLVVSIFVFGVVGVVGVVVVVVSLLSLSIVY